MNPEQFVNWYHNKFTCNYTKREHPTIRRDHEVLVTLAHHHSCQSALEIGTWKGDTALMLWLLPIMTRVHAIDVHDRMPSVIGFAHAKNTLMPRDSYGTMFRNTPVTLEFSDTLTHAPLPDEQYDLVFIDGNHDYAHVANDTRLALLYSPKIIVWHDYGAGNDDVVKYIDQIEKAGTPIRRFSGSLCVSAEPHDIRLPEADNDDAR